LDSLGPVVVYFLGVDKEKGVVVGDEQTAISCHLKAPALQQLADYLETN